MAAKKFSKKGPNSGHSNASEADVTEGQNALASSSDNLDAAMQRFMKTQEAAAAQAEKHKAAQDALGDTLKTAGSDTGSLDGAVLTGVGAGLAGGPAVGIAAGAGAVFDDAMQKIKANDALMDSLGESAAKPLADFKQNLQEALIADTFDNSGIVKYFQGIAEAANAAAEAIKSHIAIQRGLLSEKEQEQKAQEDLELKRVASDPSLNEIQKAEAVANIKKHYAELETQNKQDEVGVQDEQAKQEFELARKNFVRIATEKDKFEKENYSPEKVNAIKRALATMDDKGPLGVVKKSMQAKLDSGDVHGAVNEFDKTNKGQAEDRTKTDLENTKKEAEEGLKSVGKESESDLNARIEEVKKLIAEDIAILDKKSSSRSDRVDAAEELFDLKPDLESLENVASIFSRMHADEKALSFLEASTAQVEARAEEEKQYIEELEKSTKALAKAREALEHQTGVFGEDGVEGLGLGGIKKRTINNVAGIKGQSATLDAENAIITAMQKEARDSGEGIVGLLTLIHTAHMDKDEKIREALRQILKGMKLSDDKINTIMGALGT